MFWRARAGPDGLVVELEVPAGTRPPPAPTWRRRSGRSYGIDARCTGCRREAGAERPADPHPDVVKPRSLFGPDEDWDSALLYY